MRALVDAMFDPEFVIAGLRSFPPSERQPAANCFLSMMWEWMPNLNPTDRADAQRVIAAITAVLAEDAHGC